MILWLLSNFLKKFVEKLYGDQSREFVFGYWVLKGSNVILSMLINSPSGWQASLTILGRNSFKPMSVAVEKRRKIITHYYKKCKASCYNKVFNDPFDWYLK